MSQEKQEALIESGKKAVGAFCKPYILLDLDSEKLSDPLSYSTSRKMLEIEEDREIKDTKQEKFIIENSQEFSRTSNDAVPVISTASCHSWFLSPGNLWTSVQQGFNYVSWLLPTYVNHSSPENSTVGDTVQPTANLISVYSSDAEKKY